MAAAPASPTPLPKGRISKRVTLSLSLCLSQSGITSTLSVHSTFEVEGTSGRMDGRKDRLTMTRCRQEPKCIRPAAAVRVRERGAPRGMSNKL